MPCKLSLLPLILDQVPWAVRQALAQEGIPARTRIPGLCEGRFLIVDSQRGLFRPPARGQIVIDLADARRELPQDPIAALEDERSQPHRWNWEGQVVIEEIARCAKRAARAALVHWLRQKIEPRGGVWLRLAPFPFPYRSALNLRLDHDEYAPEHFSATLDLLEGCESFTSHYVNGAAYQPHLGALAQLRGMDVGSHGYWHHTYLTEFENLRNLRRGIEVLRSARIEPAGFVAPHGRFNRGLLAAMEKLALPYSSEFGLAYDELPFFPEHSSVLQIPVHPVCPEIFFEAAVLGSGSPGGKCPSMALAQRAAREAAAAYFVDTARAKHQAGEPMFFYGHPTGPRGGYPQVLQALLDATRDLSGVWRTTLTEFGQWWRARGSVRLRVLQAGDGLTVHLDDAPPAAYRLGVELCRKGRIALIPVEGQVLHIAPQALAYQKQPSVHRVEPVRIARPAGLGERIKRWIDWEHTTPWEEIAANNWRNWTKRLLRRLRDTRAAQRQRASAVEIVPEPPSASPVVAGKVTAQEESTDRLSATG